MLEDVYRELKQKMEKSVHVVRDEIRSIRTGRASPSLLDGVMVEAYEAEIPLNQLAGLSAPEPTLITIQPYDKGQIKNIETAILTAGLGLNPSNDGEIIRLPIPALSEERRKEYIKKVGILCEEGKMAIRQIRREGNSRVVEFEKSKEISEDQKYRAHDEIQKTTDQYITEIEELRQKKQQLLEA